MPTLSVLENLGRDLKFSLRTLTRNPGFTCVAVLTIALGIGANTAMFSVVQGVLLAPLPFPQADRLVFVWQNRPGVPQLEASYPNFAIESVVHASSPDQPLYGVKTIDEVISESMSSRNLPIMLLGAFAGLALLLASVGIYGVVSYSVARRTQEIGIRMALGANRNSIFRMIVNQAMHMAGAGLLVGIVAAIALVRLLPSFSHLLYGVRQWDPLTILGSSAVLLTSAVLACYVPARRAMRTDPMDSLRSE